MNSIEMQACEEKDHFRLIVNGVDIFGKQEKSTYRHLISVMDDGINTGLQNNGWFRSGHTGLLWKQVFAGSNPAHPTIKTGQ